MYSVVRLSRGGGVREKEWDRSTELREVFEDMQRMFFPNNRSSKGIHISILESFFITFSLISYCTLKCVKYVCKYIFNEKVALATPYVLNEI